jgi:hypothetical protein
MYLTAMSRDFVSDVNLPEAKPRASKVRKEVYCRTPEAMAESLRQCDPFQAHWTRAEHR